MSDPQPDWSTAPTWATHWGVDADGSAWWYAYEPFWITQLGTWARLSRKPDMFVEDRKVEFPEEQPGWVRLIQRPEVTA